MLATLEAVGTSAGGWVTHFRDPDTGERWTRTDLGGASNGGGQTILVKEPAPTVAELLALAVTSVDLPEVAASGAPLVELDPVGANKAKLVAIAEAATSRSPRRAASTTNVRARGATHHDLGAVHVVIG